MKLERNLCLGHEIEFRKEANKLMREKVMSLGHATGASLCTPHNNDHLRMENWWDFLNICGSDDSE